MKLKYRPVRIAIGLISLITLFTWLQCCATTPDLTPLERLKLSGNVWHHDFGLGLMIDWVEDGPSLGEVEWKR